MRTLVVYESMFGNTHAIAAAIAEGVRRHGDVRVVPVADADADVIAAADLVVVGGPTHARGMTREQTRQTARQHGDQRAGGLRLDPGAVEEGPGVREWLQALPRLDGKRGAAFDTRVELPAVLSGRASPGIANGLRARGVRLVAAPESFLVDRESKLVPAEQERAVEWGASLVADLVPIH